MRWKVSVSLLAAMAARSSRGGKGVSLVRMAEGPPALTSEREHGGEGRGPRVGQSRQGHAPPLTTNEYSKACTVAAEDRKTFPGLPGWISTAPSRPSGRPYGT